MKQLESKTTLSNICLKESGETSHRNNKSTKLDGKVKKYEPNMKIIEDP